MAKASCSVCGGGIDTESSPSGKCVRCSERAARKSPLAVTAPKAAPPPPSPAPEPPAAEVGAFHGVEYGGPPPKAPPPAVVPAPDQTLSAGELARARESLVGAIPTVEHKHEHAETHAAPRPHGKKHGG